LRVKNTRKSDFVKGAILASPKPDLPDVDKIAELTEQLTDAQDKLEKMFASASNISESAVTLLMQRDELRNRVAELEKVLAAIVDNPDDNTYWIKQAKAAIDAARVEYDIGRHPEKGTQ